MEVKSGRITNPGNHSTYSDPKCHEVISKVDKLAEKLWTVQQEYKHCVLAAPLDKQTQHALIQSVSNSLAPPPPPPTMFEKIKASNMDVHNGLHRLEGAHPPMISPIFESRSGRSLIPL